ncbi:WXG100-like domain-containing protein [Catenuloplanes atrovinosus]|uniref:Outer membrane channel protein CpnT-like N-terminal domain-containing protein n=1 Tax=Catenuloplanes atrovinosus TaxID=137266 RepID=A0AAE3YPT6_9ACTN|nr:hypothetical protein [Catenuloplanes atrovinosus]MDR7276114.1 hypothetical protein [Catenuloplanes atrovinosus]
MGLQLPGELISLLGILGFTWPEADETALLEMGQAWTAFSTTLDALAADAATAATTVWTQQSGGDIAAFQAWWGHEDSPAAALRDGVTAATVTGTGLMLCGMIVLGLKIAVIIQLTILAIQIAQAIATAAVTFGASLLEIPIFQALARTIISGLIDEVIAKLLEA